MNLKMLKEEYAKGSLQKADFIKSACELHQTLFSYDEILGSCDIDEIRIDTDGVIFKVAPDGLWLRCPIGESRVAPLEIMNFGAYEPRETEIMMSLLTGAQVVIDIGANIGWFSLLFASRCPNAKIHAFEPLPLFFNYLQQNVKLNGFEKTVSVHQIGLSDENKDVSYFVEPGNGTNASMINVADSDNVQVIGGKVITLDQWVSQTQVEPDFVKCDVEGAELLVMRGADSVLTSSRPIVFLEMLRKWAKPYGYHPNDLIGLFKQYGYICCGIGESGNRLVESVDDVTPETNYVFFHRVKHLSQIDSMKMAL